MGAPPGEFGGELVSSSISVLLRPLGHNVSADEGDYLMKRALFGLAVAALTVGGMISVGMPAASAAVWGDDCSVAGEQVEGTDKEGRPALLLCETTFYQGQPTGNLLWKLVRYI
ncbi:hypothetical protein [Nocardia sp. NPDC057030]|uniref:hypothetical protein n=1 Tax=unclassified Nocardia TaxID=2637762 RepID=UPI00363C20E3